MLRGLVLLSLVVVACSARDIEEQGQSRRHLAAQWCEDWCTFWIDCNPDFAEWPLQDCRESCEGDEAWDWTDHCGDLKWEYRECKSEASCEALLDVDNPCQDYFDAFITAQCRYDRPHEGATR